MTNAKSRTAWWLGLLAATGLSCADRRLVLHVYNWSDYINPELVRQFEREHSCRVVMDFYDSNEAMYAKLKAGATGYDVLFPSSYMVSIMRRQGMLQPLQHDRLPNLVYLSRDFLRLTEDPDMEYSVPYMISATGIGYLRSRVPDAKPSWAMFDRADLAGRITLLNDYREVIGAALKFLGYSLNTTRDEELAQAREVILRWKKNIAKFESDQYKNGLISGEFLLCHGYNGDVFQTMAENADIAFLLPEEGTSIASDDMVIPTDAKQVELAHEFINFLCDPDVAAKNMEYVCYLSPNTAAWERVSAELRQEPAIMLGPEVFAHGEVIRDLGDDTAKYTRLWDEIKSAE